MRPLNQETWQVSRSGPAKSFTEPVHSVRAASVSQWFSFLTRDWFRSILFTSARFSGLLVDDEGGRTWPEPRGTCKNGYRLFRPIWTVKTLSTLPYKVQRP
jgi:hypothetical protein